MADRVKFEDGEAWVTIDMDLCAGIAACVDVCPVECYKLVDGKVNADRIGECIECLACENICPEEAILEHFAW